MYQILPDCSIENKKGATTVRSALPLLTLRVSLLWIQKLIAVLDNPKVGKNGTQRNTTHKYHYIYLPA